MAPLIMNANVLAVCINPDELFELILEVPEESAILEL